MKGKVLALVMAAAMCFTGCGNLYQNTVLVPEKAVELVLAIPEDGPQSLVEVARELARRAEDFAGSTIAVELRPVEDIWQTIIHGEADLAISENSRIAEYSPRLRQLESPYCFMGSQNLVSAANAPEVLDALNYSLEPYTPMTLRRIASSGRMDIIIKDSEKLRLWREEKEPFRLAVEQGTGDDEALSEQWNIQLIESPDPLDALEREGADAAEIELARDIGALDGEMIIFSGHRINMVDIFCREDTLHQMKPEQQAAVEEAIVYAAGYCRTLSEDAYKKVQQQVDEQNIAIAEPDIRWLYEQFQLYYLHPEQGPDKKLMKLLKQHGDRF